MSHEPQHADLVRIADLSQELTVGVGGVFASVRTLTNVSLTVRAQELVVLSGSRGAGERALLAVIAGDRRGVTGTCDVNLHTRVRAMRIGAAAALALTQEWARAGAIAHGATTRPNAAELFLLDVVRETAALQNSPHAPRRWTEGNRPALLEWAVSCRSRGGAVVMAAGHVLGNGLLSHAMAQLTPGQWPSALPPRAGLVYERRADMPPVRVVVMHSGRMAPDIPMHAHEIGRMQ